MSRYNITAYDSVTGEKKRFEHTMLGLETPEQAVEDFCRKFRNLKDVTAEPWTPDTDRSATRKPVEAKYVGTGVKEQMAAAAQGKPAPAAPPQATPAATAATPAQ